MDTDELKKIWQGDGESCDVEQARDIARNQFLRFDRTEPNNSQCELPQEILNQLDPKLAELFSRMPCAASSRTASLVGKALQLPMHPNQLVKYAVLYAEAERQAESDAVTEDHATRSRHELVGEFHDLRTGYLDTTAARQRYRYGRRARQQIAASVKGLLTNWERVEQVVLKHREDVPVYQKPNFSNEKLAAIRERLLAMGTSIVSLGRDVLIEKSRGRKLTVPAQTYIWWRFAMASYRGKWNEMHRLAIAWRLSDARDVETFRRMVVRISRGVRSMHYPFGSSWQSMLSEKPGHPRTPPPTPVT